MGHPVLIEKKEKVGIKSHIFQKMNIKELQIVLSIPP